MELFNETKNKYYDIIIDLIFHFDEENKIHFNKLSSMLNSELIGNNINFKNALLLKNCEDNLHILKDENGVYSLNVDSNIPIIPTLIEKTWLKHMLDEDLIRLFLDKETIDKLSDALLKYQDIIGNKIIIQHRSKNHITNYDNLKEKIKKIITAIKEGKGVKYSYITKNGMPLENRQSVPFKIEYSLKNHVFYLISYSLEEKRPVKSIIENFTDIELIEIKDDITMEHIKESIFLKRCCRAIVLEVKNINNALERAFLTLSMFNKTARYMEERDIHELSVFYYQFEEDEVLDRIFSLGKGVIVKEPHDIRNKIIQRINSTLAIYFK